MNKQCSLCRQWQPMDNFPKNPTSLDGRMADCLRCRGDITDPPRVEGGHTQSKEWEQANSYHAKQAAKLDRRRRS